MRESKLNTRHPEPFHGCDRCKWKPFVTECLMTFFAKPVTFQGDHKKVTFAASYLTETAQSHYSISPSCNIIQITLHSTLGKDSYESLEGCSEWSICRWKQTKTYRCYRCMNLTDSPITSSTLKHL